MTDERSDEARQNFEYFSNEYAQALHAFKAIEDQSTTLMLPCNSAPTSRLGTRLVGSARSTNLVDASVCKRSNPTGGLNFPPMSASHFQGTTST